MYLILFYVAVFPSNINIPVFLGLSESCVYLLIFYLAVFPRNTTIPVFHGLSEGSVHLIAFYVAVFLRNTKIPVSLICLIYYHLHVKQLIRCFP